MEKVKKVISWFLGGKRAPKTSSFPDFRAHIFQFPHQNEVRQKKKPPKVCCSYLIDFIHVIFCSINSCCTRQIYDSRDGVRTSS